MKVDKNELVKIQSFILNSLAPLTTLLNQGKDKSRDEVWDATSAAVELIGNTNAQTSSLRRERSVIGVNEVLLSLARDD